MTAAVPHGIKWDATDHLGKVVMVVLSFLTLGVQATFVTFTRAGSVDEAGAASIARVFLQTAPLTIAIGLITLAAVRKWWAETSSLLFFSGVVLLVSLYLGSWLGGLGDVSSVQGNLGTFLFRSLAFYWRHYGAKLFLSSLILGPFLAIALSRQWEKLDAQLHPRILNLPRLRIDPWKPPHTHCSPDGTTSTSSRAVPPAR